MFGFDMVLPMNTGAEAVETAIKIARKWGYKVKGIPHDQAYVFGVQENFHGRTVSVPTKHLDSSYSNNLSLPQLQCQRTLSRETITVLISLT
jgi:ornithine--oxo-acid transaminase